MKIFYFFLTSSIPLIIHRISHVKEMWFSDNELQSYKIRQGDILVSEGGEVGRTRIWKNELEEYYIQNSVNKVTVKEGEPYFYLTVLPTWGQRYFLLNCKQGKYSTFNEREIKGIAIFLFHHYKNKPQSSNTSKPKHLTSTKK